jgi:hypothetical protein
MIALEMSEVSDSARLLARLVGDRRLLGENAVSELKRLLGHQLAEPPMAARRWDNLALLVELITAGAGELPTVREYEGARSTQGSAAPAASTLSKRYGTWLGVLRAASRLVGPQGSGPARAERHRRRPGYRPTDTAAALARFHATFGCWPAYQEYAEWTQIVRRTARACGAADPCLPGGPTTIRHYGTFDRAIQAAAAIYPGATG